MARPPNSSQALLDAQLELWHHTFGYIKSMALKSAVDLRIPDAIHDHGCAATLSQIVTKVTLHPSKFQCLRRLMRVLTATGVFSVQHSEDGNEQVYGLTPASHLLVGNPNNMTPFLNLMLDRIIVSPFHDFSKWFQLELPDPSLFEWALHDSDDDKCVKILKNCKKAIPPRDKGGKVIIVDMVVGAAGQSNLKNNEVQALFDLFVMFVNGIERDEQDWKKIFCEAGFSDYKVTPVLGVGSIIEVYP
ncbi:O-methyltransferase ZRP4-like [Panicum miliaceum]|uniref:O-methyltransferase ZRP4-like n=1 Tax=Panicum miliaceum TaxID=4540 RepID=A0A3L6QKY3_PANMI|nr:O-methyltransferase ZRP4-like [Panicum miliaceum]